MRKFNSLEDVAKEVRRTELKKQIALEQLKLKFKSVGSLLKNGIEPSEIGQFAGHYLGRFIHNKLKNR